MCGRKTLTKDKSEIILEYLSSESDMLMDWQPSHNIVPSQVSPILVHNGNRVIMPMQWGLVPSWSKDKKIGFKMINARSETLLEKKSFAPLLQSHRCVVITDGYYEWQKTASDKQPFFIYKENRDFLPMAGLWTQWQSEMGEKLNTYTIITTAPNKEIASIYERMPAILSKDNLNIWLNHEKYSQEEAISLLKPFDKKLQFHPVSKYVNSPKNNDIHCIEKYESGNLSLF